LFALGLNGQSKCAAKANLSSISDCFIRVTHKSLPFHDARQDTGCAATGGFRSSAPGELASSLSAGIRLLY